jgi:hypothetical protein
MKKRQRIPKTVGLSLAPIRDLAMQFIVAGPAGIVSRSHTQASKRDQWDFGNELFRQEVSSWPDASIHP